MLPQRLTDAPLEALRAAMRAAMEFQPPAFDVEIAALGKHTKSLRAWLGGRGMEKPPQNASRAALRDFVRTRDLPTIRHATLATFGCTEPFDDLRYGLIADGDLFPELLRRVDDWREHPRALRLCYRGLLHAYFQYDVERSARAGAPRSAGENWGRLRSYLGERSALIGTPGFQPPWVDVLRRNPDVLADDAGAAYGEEIFRGRAERFEEVKSQLPVTEGSWFLWRVILGQIEAATALPDAEFKAALPVSIDLLERHPAAKTYGLSRLLSRYRRCAEPVLHERLRDFAVDTWGNPWLTMNEAAWSAVDADARLMVAEWLKLALIQKFFRLLADDGVNDTRRLKFWEAYHRSIHAMYFALGETTRTRRDPDYREVRKQMAGLQMTLTNNTASNNAFIMCIGRHVIVEFGEKGNACYIFERDRLPFAFDGEVAGNYLALKHANHVERLTHKDNRDETWEDKFRAVLTTIVKAQAPPAGARSAVRGVPNAPINSRTASDPVIPEFLDVSPPRARADAALVSRLADTVSAPHATPFSKEFNERDFDMFCRANALEFRDARKQMGYLRVSTNRKDPAVADQLTAWEFHFNGKLWWRS